MQQIVMGRTAEGSTVFREAGLPDWTELPGLPGVHLAELWGAEATPLLPVGLSRPGGDMTRPLPAGATSFRLVRIEPGAGMPLHATETIDYLIVLSGEVCAGAGKRDGSGARVWRQRRPTRW